jgi:hypothetical protein
MWELDKLTSLINIKNARFPENPDQPLELLVVDN